jgi:hypothetical protein
MQNPLRPGLKALGSYAERFDPFKIDLFLAVGDVCFRSQQLLKVRDPLTLDSCSRACPFQGGDSFLMILSPWPFAAESN